MGTKTAREGETIFPSPRLSYFYQSHAHAKTRARGLQKIFSLCVYIQNL